MVMFYFVALCALALGTHAHGKHQHVPFDAIFGNNFLAAHDLTESAFHELVHGETLAAVQSAHHASTPHSYLACGPVSELKSKRASMLSADATLADKHVRTVYQSRARSTGCLLVHAPRTVLETASVSPYRTESDSRWTFSIVPAFLKVSPSVTSFLTGQTEKMDALRQSKSREGLMEEGPVVSKARYILEASVALGALHNAPVTTHLERLSATMRAATHGTDSALHRTMSHGWKTLAADFGARDSCRVQAERIHARAGSIILTQAHDMSRACLTAVVEALAADPSVNNIRLSAEPRALNHDAKGMLESGQPAQTGTGGAAVYPYSQAGLTGAGQIAAVMDTGLDDLSCFFADDICSEGTGECLTPRDGQVYNDRRKVIQYVPYADETDYEAGHGSHVTGSVLGAGILISQPDEFGSLTSSLQGYNGVATDAKVAFQDIGDAFGGLGVLNYVSLSEEAFPVAYRAGARIHSDSWGGGLEYDQQSFEVDMYSYENDDFLVVIAAGNGGDSNNRPSVIAPSNAKNSLSVGSAQVRNEFSDKPFDATTMSSFSSIGPTPEGRIKPDIVSTGSLVSSCRSNDPILAEWAYLYDYAQVTCSTMQISGTSMATPVTSGGALLVRQYFEDESFWAARCDSEYSSCANGAFTPSGYFVKAAMIHSGQPISRYGSPNDVIPVTLSSTPNVFEGYGYATLSNVLPLEGLGQDFKLYPNDALRLSEGELMQWTVTIPSASTAALRATLVWYDPYGEFGGNLIHNLDLTIEGPSDKVYYGNNNEDGDDKNPNEQVTVWDTSCDLTNCVFNVTVSAVSVSLTEEQKFAVIISTSGEVSEPDRITGGDDDLFSPELLEIEFSKGAPVSFDELKARAKGRQSVTALPADRKLKESSPVAAMSRSLSEGITSVTVQLDPFVLQNSEGGDFKVSIEMDGSLGLLQSIDFKFDKWERTDVCPYVTNWRIETNGEQTVSAAQWPFYLANCLFDDFPFTTGVYTSTYGAAYDGVMQEEAGTWDMYFYTYSNESPISYEDVTITFNFEPQPEYLEFSTGEVVIDREEGLFEIEVVLPEGEACYRPQYVWLDFLGGDCESRFDLFLTDAQSRVTPVTYQYDFTDFSTEDVVNFIDESTLRGGGTYTLGVVVQSFEECPSATIDVTVAMRPTPCEEELTSVETHSIEFSVQLDSCAVLNPDFVGDGYCDWDTPGGYNTAGCGFDGGDCCEESCVNAYYPCGYNGFFCKDPEYSAFSGSYAYNNDDDDDDDDDSTCHVGVEAWIGDGYCDGGNYNTAGCNWDGGDCCEHTCEDTEENTCGANGYNCLADAYSAEYSGLDSIGVYSAQYSDNEDDDIVLDRHRRLLEVELSAEYSGEASVLVYSMDYSQAVVFSSDMGSDEFSNAYSNTNSFSDDIIEDDDVYSSTYSNNNPYENSVVLIDRFVQRGNLEYVTLTLDGLETSFANYALGVLVVDPLTRTLQLGSLDSFSYYWPNSGSQTWPGSWNMWESFSYTATRDVRAAGLSSLDYSNLRDDRRRLEESSAMHAVERMRSAALRKDHLKSRSKGEKMASKRMLEGEEDYWEVYMLLATNEHDVMNFTFAGVVDLKFDTDATVAPTFSPTLAPTAVPTTAQPSIAPTRNPTAVPTLAPTVHPTQIGQTNAPTRRPTRTPTRRPTGSKVGTYIEFNTTIEYDGVECDDFTTDAAALEAARQATLTSLNENMEDDEVKSGVPEECARRRLRYSNLDVQVVKRGLATVTMVSFTTRANINNLGESDPNAVYNDMKASLNEDIESGDYTTLVQSNGEALGTSTLDSVSVTQVPVYSDVIVFEVVGDDSSSSSSGGDDDEETNIIIGCVIGGFFFLVIVAGAVYWFFFREADDNMSGAKNTGGASSTNSAHTATVGAPNSGSYKKGSTNDDMRDNPIFTKGESGGKAADNYGGL